MHAEAHRKHRGIGTLLVKKVSQFYFDESPPSPMCRSEDAVKKWLVITLFKSFLSTSAPEARTLESSQGVLFLRSQVSKEVASEFGELVADPKTGELLHYAEKPETFVMSWPPFNFLLLWLSEYVLLKWTFFTAIGWNWPSEHIMVNLF